MAKTEDPADESKVEAVKNALTNGSISMWVANDAEAVAAAEDGGVKALEALASGETDAQRKQELLQFVPDYMVPKKFVFLEQMPMTNNGKADRKKLAELGKKPERKVMV